MFFCNFEKNSHFENCTKTLLLAYKTAISQFPTTAEIQSQAFGNQLEISSKTQQKFIRKLLKNYLLFQVSGLVKNIRISTPFSTPQTIKNHHKTMKKQGLNVNLKIYFIFDGFLMDSRPSWVFLGPPWAPFFSKNAARVGG